MAAAEQPPVRGLWQALWDGMRLYCPVCGRGRIYRSASEMHRACPACGVVFEPREGDFLGAMAVAYAVTAVWVVTVLLVLNVVTDLSPAGQVVAAAALGAVFLLLLYRNLKGAWLGVLHTMRRVWEE